MITRKCKGCGEVRSVNSRSLICYDCEEEIEKEAKEGHLAAVKTLPVEKRLELIEEWIYDLNHNPPWKRNLLR